MAYNDDENELLSQEEYFQRVHQPDIYGQLGRAPASLPQDLEPVDEEYQQSEDTAENAVKADEPQEIRDEADALMPTQAAAPASPLDRYTQFMDEYRRLQEGRRSSDLTAGLMSAGNTIGQSLAGRHSGNFKPDQSGVELVQKMGERPVTDFEQAQKVHQQGIQLQSLKEQHDPTSSISDAHRRYFVEKILPKDSEGKPRIDLFPNIEQYSAADIQNLLKLSGSPSQRKGAQIVRTYNPATGQIEVKSFDPATGTLNSLNETAGFALQARQNPRTGETTIVNPATGKLESTLTGPSPASQEQPTLTRDNLTVNQQKQLDDARKEFLQDSADDRKAVQAAQSVRATLRTGKKIGGDILRDIQNQLARGSGEKGAMTENDVAPFGGRAALLDRFSRAASMALTGQLPDSDRQFLMQLADAMERRATSYVQHRAEFFSNNLYNDFKSSPNLRNSAFDRSAVNQLLGTEHPMVEVVSKKTGKKMRIPADKVNEAREKRLIE